MQCAYKMNEKFMRKDKPDNFRFDNYFHRKINCNELKIIRYKENSVRQLNC